MLQAQAEFKTRSKEIANPKAIVAKKSPVSDETLSPLLERAQQEAKGACNQLAHVEAAVRELRYSCEELKSAQHRLADIEAEITRLQDLLQQENPLKRLVSYDEL